LKYSERVRYREGSYGNIGGYTWIQNDSNLTNLGNPKELSKFVIFELY